MNKEIKKLFSKISRTYELTNHILTLGLDVFWRKRAARVAAQEGGIRWLDVCCGTAQTAVYLRRFANQETTIVAVDFCLPMLREARVKGNAGKIFLCLAEAGRLPFADNTFDLVTISFATRNINTSQDSLIKHFQEFHRIIKRGGRFLSLETSQPESVFLKKIFHLYVGLIVRPVGFLISGSKAAYNYLAYTIPRFFKAKELSDIIYQSGFSQVSLSYLGFGITAIHIAKK